jgi:predicted nucleic acid-binding protein
MHDGPVIVNNTPLVALWALRRLDLFQALFGEVLAPAAVHAEFLATERSLRQSMLATAFWIRPTKLADPRRADTFMGIGRGEAEVLVLAQERHARLVVIDDLRARRFAKRLDIPLTGTLGMLVLAKNKGLVTSVYPLIQELQVAGIFFSASLVANILVLADESD